VNAEGLGRSVTGTVRDRAGNESSVTIDAINIDMTPPSVTAAVSRPPDMNGWYNHAFGVVWSGTDGLSGIDTCSAPASYAGPDTAAGSAAGSCADRAGNTAQAAVGFTFDATAPSIAIAQPADGATFALNETAPAASYTCSDAASGVASCAGSQPLGAAIDTASPGARSLTVNALDLAGNPATLTHRYAVRYAFDGFLAPLNNLPTMNRGPAGRTYPVKWILRDGNGAYINDPTAIAAVTLVPGSCGGTVADVAGEDTDVDVGGLRFDPLTGVWLFNWQTQKSQAGCWSLQLRLADGSVRALAFELR
jgi:hypothetical protein